MIDGSMDWQILIVENEVADATMLAFLLNDRGYQTMAVDNQRAVMTALQERGVDLIFINVALPFIDGITLCDLVRRQHPGISVIFLGGRENGDDRLRAFEHGADDYITKPYVPDVLLARVQAVLRRHQRSERTLPPTILSVGETKLDIGRLQFQARSRRSISLTPTETRILECLMRNAHSVVPRARLIDLTNRQGDGDRSNRIDVYIRRLRQKIESIPDQPDFIHTVRGLGYTFRDDQADTAKAAG
jgi:two-component system response regulator RegX3